MRGRKPVPTVLKQERGTYRADRTVSNEAQFPVNDRMPSPPDTLNEYGQQVWRAYGKMLLDAGLLTKGDYIALELLCQAYGRWIEAEKQVAKHGTVLKSKTSGNLFQNPYLSVANRAWEQVKKMLAEFGLTPAERTRVAAMLQDEEQDLASILFSGLHNEQE